MRRHAIVARDGRVFRGTDAYEQARDAKCSDWLVDGDEEAVVQTPEYIAATTSNVDLAATEAEQGIERLRDSPDELAALKAARAKLNERINAIDPDKLEGDR